MGVIVNFVVMVVVMIVIVWVVVRLVGLAWALRGSVGRGRRSP